MWYLLYESITKKSNIPNFGHIPILAYEYCLRIAKGKYLELVHYGKKHNFPFQDVINAVNIYINYCYNLTKYRI